MNLDDVNWLKIDTHSDIRGSLSSIEANLSVPFDIKRVFYIHNISKGIDRGGHAHIDTDQCAIAIHGSLKVRVSDGIRSKIFILNNPNWGIYLPRFTWTDLYSFSEDAVCLVLASTRYDKSKSLRSWSDYLRSMNLSESAPIPKGFSELNHP